MKENKVNINLIVPAVGKTYNLFVPVNKSIGEVIAILNNSINELTHSFPLSNKLSIFNVVNCKFYKYEEKIPTKHKQCCYKKRFYNALFCYCFIAFTVFVVSL